MPTTAAAAEVAAHRAIHVADEGARRALVDALVARGTIVPFSTPALFQARLRVNASGHLEALLPAFSGADGIYIVPFQTLPTVATMTVHDRALFSAIVERDARSPEMLHAAAYEVARKGLAGARAADAAAKALARERDEAAVAKACLVAGAISQASDETSPSTIEPEALLQPGGFQRAHAMLAPIARAIGASPAVMLERLDDWSGLIAAIGVGASDRPARLRRVARSVLDLANQVRRWLEDDGVEADEAAQELVVIAAEVASIGSAYFAQLDDLAGRASATLADWEDRRRGEIAALAKGASWILDGWDFHVLSWRDAAQGSRADQAETIREIRSVFPRNLAHVFQPAVDMEPELPGRRAVRLNESWRSSRNDSVLRRRLERLKEQTL